MMFQVMLKLERILLLQDDDALLRLSGAFTLRPATEVFVLVKPSIRVLDIDLRGTVSLVSVPSLLMCRIVVGASSDCWKSEVLLYDHGTPSSDVFSHLCSASAVWKT